MNITDRPTPETDNALERGIHVPGLIERARHLEQQRDVAVDALKKLRDAAKTVSAQTSITRITDGLADEILLADRVLATIKESK